MKPHLNANGEICNCGFGRYNEPVEENLIKEAGAKLEWLRERNDKFLQSEEGQIAFDWLERNVEAVPNLDPLAPWIWRELKKGRFENWSGDTLRHLADWYESNSPTRRGVDIMQLTDSDVRDLIRQWDEELASKMEGAEVKSGQVIADVGDGWTIRQVTSEEGAKQEGDAMGHCVGGYGRAIVSGDTLIYSLRDPKNQPHATIEIRPDYEQNKEVIDQVNRFQRIYNLVNTHFPVLRAMVESKATNDQIKETIENILEDKSDVDYKEFVAILRARLEDKEKEYYNEHMAQILTQLDPSGGKVVQIQGKENKMLVPKYREMVGNWLLGMDLPPDYDRTIENIYVPAPDNVEELEVWIEPWLDDDLYLQRQLQYADYEHESVQPQSVDDYFPNNQEHGYLHGGDEGAPEPNYYREDIPEKNWRNVVIDALTPKGDEQQFYPADKVLELLSKADKVSVDNNYPAWRSQSVPSEEFKEVLNEYIQDYLYPDFKSRFYDQEGYMSEAEQWERIPVYRYVDQLLGYNYVDPEYIPREISPEQNQLFGPAAHDPEKENLDAFMEVNNALPEGPISDQDRRDYLEKKFPEQATVPWQDPESYDLQMGKFGSRIRNWFKRRKANVLDPVSNQLDPTVWDNSFAPRPVLKPEIADWVVDFISSALDRNGYTDIDSWATFVVTGSLTTYQYSKRSDLDVSLFVNAERFPDWSRAEMIAIMMDQCDDTTVPGTGHPLQCYVVPEGFEYDDLYKPGLRSAYSIDENRWIVSPEKDRAHDVTREMNEAYTIALENADKMEKLIRYEPMKAVQYYSQVQSRRRRDQQHGKGDFAPSNISYKMMESRGLFDQIKSLKKQHHIK